MGPGDDEQVEGCYHREAVLSGVVQPQLRVLEGHRHVQLHAGGGINSNAGFGTLAFDTKRAPFCP